MKLIELPDGSLLNPEAVDMLERGGGPWRETHSMIRTRGGHQFTVNLPIADLRALIDTVTS